MKSKKIKALIFSMSLILALSACSSKQTAKEEENTVLVAVETQKVKKGSIKNTFTASSKVESNEELSVVPKMAGIVKKSYVNLGDYVNKGDVLFTIDSSDIQMQINQANSGLNLAKANYKLTVNGSIDSQIQQLEANVENLKIQYNDLLKKLSDTKELYEAGAVAKQDLDNLQNNVDLMKLQLDTAQKNLSLTKDTIKNNTKEVSSATVEQAETGVATARHQLSNTVIRAELSGVISADNVVDGQMVSMQSPAFVISDMNSVKVKFQVSEDIINQIKKGSKVYITISSISDKPIESQISNISYVADKMTSLYPVEVKIDNSTNKIKPGMFANVRLVLSDKTNVLTLPLDAVMKKDGKDFVYTLDKDNVAHKQTVTTGVQDEAQIEIKSGLSDGMQVVVKGQQFIDDNSKVNVVNK